MLITFSEKFVEGRTMLEHRVAAIINQVSISNYRMTWQSDTPVGNLVPAITWARGNLVPAITWARGRRVRFTIETRDAWAHGSRVSHSGRHMRKASWEAHRDVIRALFALDPDAVIRTALATYRGAADFERQYERTGEQNIGGNAAPRTMRDCTI